jgi:hypothetical protein
MNKIKGNELSKECIELINEKFPDSTLVYHPNSPMTNSRSVERNAAIWALTTPEIYQAANLIEATTLEGRKSAEQIFNKITSNGMREMTIERFSQAMEEYANQIRTQLTDEELEAEVIVVGNGVPKELTPIDRLIIAEMYDLDKQVTKGQISFSRMVEIINEKFEKIIRKKEREAARKAIESCCDVINTLEDIETYLNENYPL